MRGSPHVWVRNGLRNSYRSDTKACRHCSLSSWQGCTSATHELHCLAAAQIRECINLDRCMQMADPSHVTSSMPTSLAATTLRLPQTCSHIRPKNRIARSARAKKLTFASWLKAVRAFYSDCKHLACAKGRLAYGRSLKAVQGQLGFEVCACLPLNEASIDIDYAKL